MSKWLDLPSVRSDKGIDLLKERFVKHVRCGLSKEAREAAKKAEATTLTIVSKQKDSITGVETLKTEKLNYVPSQTMSPAGLKTNAFLFCLLLNSNPN